METLLGRPWRVSSLAGVTILFTMPLLFFASASFAVLFLASGLVLSTSAKEQVKLPRESALFSATPPSGSTLGETAVSAEARPTILREFLASYHSPLAPYSDLILQVSDKYGLDWRLLVTIAGAESTFGRNVIDDTHNAWGWGIHARGTLYFSSWEEGIETVARGLKEKFLDHGLITVDEIMAKYAPVSLANGGSWARAVNYFMDKLERAEYR